MNQRLVESLAQIILFLTNEERQLLENKIKESSLSQKIADLEGCLKNFEEKYNMPSKHFTQHFQSGELGDYIDLFEWNTYYEMWNAAQIQAY